MPEQKTMNATKTEAQRIDPLMLSQNTAIGRTPGKPTDWYIYQVWAVDDVFFWAASPAGARRRATAVSPAPFVCAVTPPEIMFGSSEQCRDEIESAVLRHAEQLGMLTL